MRRLLFVLLLLCSVSPAFASNDLASNGRIKGIGKDRESLSEDQIVWRERMLEINSDFFLLRFTDLARLAPQRIFAPEIYSIIIDAAQQNGLDPMLLASVIFIESYGRTDVKSPTGPAGIAQLTTKSAKELGLTVHKKIGSHIETRAVTKGRGKKARVVYISKKVTDYSDDRLNPAKAIPAMARRIASRIRMYGSVDLALFEYHNGAGNALDLLRTAFGKKIKESEVHDLLENFPLDYPTLFFSATPYHNTKVYDFLQKINKKVDFGDTYPQHVHEAQRLLDLYQKNPAEYDQLVDLFVGRFGKPVLPNWQWSFLTEEQAAGLAIGSLEQLKELEEGLNPRIVKTPQNLNQFGVTLRTTGNSPIAQASPENLEYYSAAEPATLGLLLYVANETARLMPKGFTPLQTNSLVRDLQYQTLGLVKHAKNVNAETSLPMHVYGWAFDLPLSSMSKQMQKAVEFVLSDMRYAGLLAYIREGKAQFTFHVVPHPSFREYFAQYYWEMVGHTQTLATSSR